jgi:hypothetical protein
MDAFTLTERPKAHRFNIEHNLANEISVVSESSDGSTAEIAFFLNSNWVTEIMQEFAGYADAGYDSDTLVYRYVPKYLVSTFIDAWS